VERGKVFDPFLAGWGKKTEADDCKVLVEVSRGNWQDALGGRKAEEWEERRDATLEKTEKLSLVKEKEASSATSAGGH